MVVKLADESGIKIAVEELCLTKTACVAGSKSTNNRTKVHFPETEMHFYAMSMKLKKLEKQVEDLKMENEILKKFQAFLKQKNV